MARHQALAFDRASVRTFDVEGRMHVAITNISREQVADYLGREIPGCQELGLDPEKIYSLYRPAEELEKAAATFNNVPLLTRHVRVTPEDPRQDLVVGSTGSESVVEGGYLKNSLVVWVADAIENIESGEAKELSCSYHYKPVLRKGTFNGQAYDIVMTDIKANHVALVPAGRAGPTVVVGDSLPKELQHMSKKAPPSRMALIARGAVLALSPRLASDAKLDASSLTAGVTAANWIERKPALLAALKPLLASDADVGTLHKLLDGLDSDAAAGGAGMEDVPAAGGEGAGAPALAPGETDKALDATDADPCAELLQMLAGKLSPEDMTAFEAALRAAIAPPAADGGEGPPATPGTPPNPADKEKDMITQTAMDAALAKTKTAAVAEGRKLAREIAEAEAIAKPFVGVLPAMDSAEDVFKSALELLNIKTEGIHPSAFRAILEAQPKPGSAVAGGPRMAVAMDAQAEVATQFPDAKRIRIHD
jgi:hypothetical protein